jgi:hypothetical protein
LASLFLLDAARGEFWSKVALDRTQGQPPLRYLQQEQMSSFKDDHTPVKLRPKKRWIDALTI